MKNFLNDLLAQLSARRKMIVAWFAPYAVALAAQVGWDVDVNLMVTILSSMVAAIAVERTTNKPV